MSLFGSQAPANSGTTTGSLFGNLGGNTSNNNPSGGLFSNLGSSRPPASTSNLFGSLGGATANTSQPQTSTPNLFGASQNTPPAQPSGGLFGGNQPATTAPSVSLFGGNNPASEQERKENAGRDKAEKVDASGQPALFLSLLERGKKNNHTSGDGAPSDDLPTLQLGLGDIQSRIRNLTGAGQGDSRADYVLSGSGVPRGATRRNLDDFGSQTAAGLNDSSAPYASDVDAYIANLRAKSTLDLINENMEQTKRDFDTFLEDRLSMNLEAQRRRAYEYFGLARPNEHESLMNESHASLGGSFGASKNKTTTGTRTAAFGRSTFKAGGSTANSILGRSTLRGSTRQTQFTDVPEVTASAAQTSALDDPFQRARQDKYAEKIRQLNGARLSDTVFPVIEQFAQVEFESSGDVPKHLKDAYRALKEIVKETSKVERPSDPGAVRERQYRDSYLDTADNSQKSILLRKQILDGSRKFLEDSFYQHVEDTLKRNRTTVDIGGIPSKTNKVRAFVTLRGQQKKLANDTDTLQRINDEYCWAFIFYLLRAGLVEEAARYVRENERAIKNMDRNFSIYMGHYARDPERKLPREVVPRIQSEYGQRSRLAPEQSIDPYRMACLKIIGRCELSKKTLEGMDTDVEDFLWLNFVLAREVNRAEESAADVYGLEDVRATIEDIGQRFFVQPGSDVGSTYAIYFLMQILTGMFERAVSWLHNHNYVAAVHFAIALDFYGLLRVSDYEANPDQLLSYTTTQRPQLNFGALVGYYTGDFRFTNAEAAADYLTLLCLNADLPGEMGKSYARLAHLALKDLVLSTREFALLLGDVQSDGRRLPGAIEQRVPLLRLDESRRGAFLADLTIQSARAADDSGRTTDAVLLYHLAGEYDNVIVICNRSLSDSLALGIEAEPLRLQPLKPRTLATAAETSAGTLMRQNELSTLSLTAVDDPATLARNMYHLYEANGLYLQKVRPEHRDAFATLSRIASVKDSLANQRWAIAHDEAAKTNLLPLNMGGVLSEIRARANAVAACHPTVSRLVGNLLVWTIQALSAQREVLRRSAFQADTLAAGRVMQNAKDLMVFAGLMKFKLPANVFDMLAREGQEVEIDDLR